ncbi:MAG: 50S ribosomal protein L3 [Acidimicrobiia bacterium]|nr:50S ribosomal protein L3 [Acidimicrobiia bacterium]MDQ3499451.1 50S ribosomal protein L3 [Actinomycetota bacterium]
MNAILGEKLGMTQVFDAQSRAIPVTVIKAGPCQVVQVKQPDSDGYSAIQLAFGDIKAKQVNKPMNGHYVKAGVEPARYLVEVRVDDPSAYQVGQKILLGDVLEKGGMADVSGLSKGKGTQGVMRRHGFQGQGAAHGTHKKHRAPGSIGACATPARVFKGMRMGGRMGSDQVTILNLQIVEVDTEHNLLLLRGAVPGANGSMVLIREAVKAQ